MDFTLLGAVEARADGRVVPLGRRRERCLLGLLLLEPGRYVTHDRLADLLWDGEPPDAARRAVHTYVARLRGVLSPHGVVIAGGPAGYRVEVDPDTVDAHRFRAAVAAARAEDAPDARADRARAALALWSGPPLVGVASEALRSRIGVGYEDLRLEAVTRLATAEIECGRADRAVDLLRSEVAAEPLREALVVRLMVAYRAAGRQSVAVELYHDTRQRLIDALGLEPGPELRAAYGELLGADMSSPAPTRHAAQLPAGVRRFSGRTAELDRLDGLAAAPGAAVVIAAMSGLGGIGKTALALHWAHRSRDRFPDGQLYVDLRGFDPRLPPLDPADALRGFLDALGVPRPPAGVDAMAARYRSLLADRRMLVMLDNARDATQVRDLLPGTPGAVTLITSRHPMTALVALSGAAMMAIDRLPDVDARALLAAHVGAARLAAEPAATGTLLRRCAGLPLALAIVGAQLATDPAATVTGIAAALDAADPLDTLDAGDPAADVRTVFSLSYRRLAPPAAEAFRRLGLHPTRTFDLYATASLLGRPATAAEPILADLILANLVAPAQPGHYTMHDLVHAYAAELSEDDPADVRAAAWARLAGHYTHTGLAADALIDPSRDPHVVDPPAAGVASTPLAAVDDAMAWYAAVKPTVLAMIARSAEAGDHERVWHLNVVMATYLDRTSDWATLEQMQRPVLEYGRRSGQPGVEVAAHHAIARALIRLGRLDDAMAHMHDGLAVEEHLGSGKNSASLHNEIATLYAARGDNAQALAHVQLALARLDGTTDLALLARTRNGVGWFHAQLGAYDEAIVNCTEAARILHETGDAFGEADTLDSLGFAHHRLGDHRRARDCYDQAYELFRSVGDALQMALVLDHRGDAEAADGDEAAARASWQASAELFTQVGRPEADAVRAKLSVPAARRPA